MSKESEPTFFLGKEAPESELNVGKRLGSNKGIDESGRIILLHSKLRGKLDDVLRILAEEKILDLSPQPTTLLCDGNLLLQERCDVPPQEESFGRQVKRITEREIWESKFLEQKRKRAESNRIDRTLGENKLP